MLQPMKVIARFTDKHPIKGTALEINSAGATIRLKTAAPRATHLWLLVGLPDGSGDCLALGEVIETNNQELRIRFKHLFPNDRRALQASLGETESETIAA